MIQGYSQNVITTSNIHLRYAPTVESKVQYHIPRGATINLDGCIDEWCEVTILGHSGFIAKQFTVSSDDHSRQYTERAIPTGPVNHNTNSKGNVVQSPTHYNKYLKELLLNVGMGHIVSVKADVVLALIMGTLQDGFSNML